MTLNIGLYPWGAKEYVEQHRRVIEHYWYNILDNKQIFLNWIEENQWDGGYYKTPKDYFDIFIYDTIFMDYFMSQGWLSALDRNEIKYANEINPKVLSLIESTNGKYYGIPIYGYRSDDQELASVTNFEDLFHIASKRHFIMRKPGGILKTSNYLFSLDQNYKINNLTEKDLNMDIINRLSHFYKYSKYLLDESDCYLFKQSSFYIGFSEDINTMLLIDENDLSQIDFMFVPLNNYEKPPCWLNCIGIHPQTKLRGTYEKSLQLANLMTCSNVMNECLKEEFYLLPINHITLSHLASNNSIYAKLQTLIDSHFFRPSLSLPVIINSSISVQEQWSHAIALIIAQHQKEMQSMTNTSTTAS
jgi:thiamine pyridinylase